MSTEAYHLLLQQIQQLTPDEQMQLLVDLVTLICQSAPEQKRSILELEGLGKGTWEGIDVDQYIKQERDSWEEPGSLLDRIDDLRTNQQN